MADQKPPHDPYLDDPISLFKEAAPFARFAPPSFVALVQKGLGPKNFRAPGTARRITTRRLVLEWLQSQPETLELRTAHMNSWSTGKTRVAHETGQDVTDDELVALREEAEGND